jgi:diguanylate cyclase (GGDEF)-like protein
MQQPDAFTVYLAIVAACLALSLVWLVVARTFPRLHAARYWFAATLAASLGIGLTLWRSLDPLAPILAGNGFVLLGSGLGWLGVRQFVGKSTPWLTVLGIMAGTIAGLAFATLVYDSLALRVVIFSAAQSVLIGWAVVDILDRRAGGITPGCLLAAGACSILLLLNAARTVLAVIASGSEMPVMASGQLQAALVFLVAVFGALVCQFGFLLMTMDRLQTEMVHLTGVDDLTGAANRRRLLAACEQECVRSVRTRRAFAIMVIDVDRFKAINDSHGHAVGDEFLKMFANTAIGQLRAQDLLARLGGDEFCVLMPETDGEQAAKTAGRLAAAVRNTSVHRDGARIGSTISIGVAQWSPAIGRKACALLDLADKALYLTKKAGRDGVTLAPLPAQEPIEPLAA